MAQMGQPRPERHFLTKGGVDPILSPVTMRALRLDVADGGRWPTA
jgi:hypothetical protein